jgi:hypothetical protein
MSHGTEEHLEHAEHAQHPVHDPFFRQVAMTMAIVAAVLACVTMLSHREHTETLRLQSEASILQTQASDQWAHYQAKKNREYQYEIAEEMLASLADAGKGPSSKDSSAASLKKENWNQKVKRYKEESEEIKKEAESYEKDARDRREQSHRAHDRADRYDLGELGVELALVLCSLAVLTKRSQFWHAGIGVGVIGACVAASAIFLH